ncbi:MAG: glycoside hydrolase family 57 protein [archaeon]|nr:glycoside hydrolase family 57 protein [archaeon]
MSGVFSLMLHAHIPYCRKSGVWPAGEEWLFEAMNETYIPLLSVFRRFQRKNIKPRIMFGVVPILAEQLADKYMIDRFHEYMEDKIDRAEKDIERFRSDKKRYLVAKFWYERFQKVYKAYKDYFYTNIMGSLKWLQDNDVIEVLTSAASHGFLPLMDNDSGIHSQIQIGISTYEKYFGRKPRGFWLPECAYRWKTNERRAIDEWLADVGIKYFFVENIGIERAEFIENLNGESKPTTFRGYKLESGVNVFGRNHATGKQVWSSEYGYPGDSYYREFHGKDSESGLHYNRVTGKSEKEVYVPSKALEISQNQADHFYNLIKNNINEVSGRITECPPIIVSQYDCELFGHWWLEGVQWIDNIYKILINQEEITILSLEEYIKEFSDTFSTIRMKPSTWGENGDFTVWDNKEHSWLWPYINSSTKTFENVLALIKSTNRMLNERDIRILEQTARELILLEGSDWPFLLYTKQAKDYANQRFHHHHQRFLKLIWALKNLDELNRLSWEDLIKMEEIDNPWSEIDYNLFTKK